MKLATFIRTAALTLLASTTLAFAQERGSADEAKALVEKGLAHVKAVGPEKAFADFNDKDSGKWVSKDLYIVVLKFDGTILAHGVNKGLLGKNLIDVKDPNGVYFTKEMIESGKKGVAGPTTVSPIRSPRRSRRNPVTPNPFRDLRASLA